MAALCSSGRTLQASREVTRTVEAEGAEVSWSAVSKQRGLHKAACTMLHILGCHLLAFELYIASLHVWKNSLFPSSFLSTKSLWCNNNQIPAVWDTQGDLKCLQAIGNAANSSLTPDFLWNASFLLSWSVQPLGHSLKDRQVGGEGGCMGAGV